MQQVKFSIDYLWSYLKWYCSHLCVGRFILPLPLACGLIDFMMPFYKQQLIRGHTMSLNYHSSPQDDFWSELMATYIRYLCPLNQQYGLGAFTPWILDRFVLRVLVYKKLLKLIFSIKPAVYMAWQRTYLHSYLPCEAAVQQNVPVAYHGSGDGTPLKISYESVQRDWQWARYECPVVFTQAWQRQQIVVQREVERKLDFRFKGMAGVDSLLFYMKTNPYDAGDSYHPEVEKIFSGSNIECINPVGLEGWSDGYVVVYMHEFNDYHHNGVLPAFASSYFEWLLLTLNILQKNEIPYLVMVHPSMLAEPFDEKHKNSLYGLVELAALLSQPLRLAPPLSSIDLLRSGMTLGCTVRGTVATELIYLRCPVVCSGSPPYQNFMPGRVVNCFEQYQTILVEYLHQSPVTTDEYIANLNYLAQLWKPYPVSRVEQKLAENLGIYSASHSTFLSL